jgi:hypothetical protein
MTDDKVPIAAGHIYFQKKPLPAIAFERAEVTLAMLYRIECVAPTIHPHG